MIGAISFPMVALIVVSIMGYVRFKSGRFFEPVFRDDFPTEFKPFMKMHGARYRATANPRHTLLPILEKTLKNRDPSHVKCDIIGYRFGYEGYTPSDDWYKAIARILKRGGEVRLLGGEPSQNENLAGLADLGLSLIHI